MNAIVFGTNHNNTLGLVWSLHEANHHIVLLLKEKGKGYVSASRYVEKIYHCVDDNKLVDTIKQISNSLNEKPVVFVSGDAEATILNDHYQELSPFCFFEGGKSDGSINKYRDKDTGNELAKKCGFALPKNVVLETVQELSEIQIQYPIFIKANNSIHGGKVAMKKCDTQQEAKLFVESMPDDYFPLQVQEFIDKEYEIMILGCSLYGGKKVICPVANRKIRQYPKHVGLGSYSESIAVKSQTALMGLGAKISQYLKEIEYTGLFSAEFLFSKGIYYFLEINLRNDGTSWLSTCSGYNLPDMVCRSFVDNNVNDENCSFTKRHYMNVLADFHFVRSGDVGMIDWLKQFNKNTCYSHYNPKDKHPAFAYYLGIIKSKMKKIMIIE